MPNYSHFDNTAPVGGSGLYVGAAGSEVQVASSAGVLYSRGNVVNYPLGHVSADSRLIAYGNATLHSESATIATGLTTIGAAVACKRHTDLHNEASSLDPTVLVVQYSAGNLIVGGLSYRPQGGGDNGGFKSSDGNAECSFDWIAMGV